MPGTVLEDGKAEQGEVTGRTSILAFEMLMDEWGRETCKEITKEPSAAAERTKVILL